MILFLDSSSIVSVYLEEEGRSDAVARHIQRADALCCSSLAQVEVRSALARALRESRVTKPQHDQALHDFTGEWPTYVRVPMSDQLLDEAADITEAHALKSLDAIQLASARSIRNQITDVVIFSSWDDGLRRAAAAEGFELLHEMP